MNLPVPWRPYTTERTSCAPNEQGISVELLSVELTSQSFAKFAEMLVVRAGNEIAGPGKYALDFAKLTGL